MCAPVSASSLRRYCTRSVLGSTSARRSTLLTVNVIGTRTPALPPLTQSEVTGRKSETTCFDSRLTTHDWLTTCFAFQTGEELTDDHLRRGLHHASANASQSAPHVSVARPVYERSLAVLGKIDLRVSGDLPCWPLPLDRHAVRVWFILFDDLDAALVRTADRRDTDLHPGLVLLGTYLDQILGAGETLLQNLWIEQELPHALTWRQEAVLPADFHLREAPRLAWPDRVVPIPSWYNDVGNSL